MKTDDLDIIEVNSGGMDEAPFRQQVLDAARRFKSNWVELAKYLYKIKKDRLFKEWGYTTLEGYYTKEIGIKKQTAFKLLSSYYFLTREEPQFLERNNLASGNPRTLPHYEAVNVLRKAKANKELKDNDYQRLREDVFDKASEPREVGKQFRSMLWAAKSVDPEEERQRRRLVSVKRLLSTFNSLKKEAELLKLLPGKLLEQAEKVISAIEEKIQAESKE